MLYEFHGLIKKLSLGKRKFLLNKMNTFVALDEKIWQGNNGEESSKILSEQDKVCEQFIYGASLLLDKGKTLKETSALIKKDAVSVTLPQYEYYTRILKCYESELTPQGKRAFCASVMGNPLLKRSFSHSKIPSKRVLQTQK